MEMHQIWLKNVQIWCISTKMNIIRYIFLWKYWVFFLNVEMAQFWLKNSEIWCISKKINISKYQFLWNYLDFLKRFRGK